MKKKLLVIFGTPSPEYYVNCQMTNNIIKNIDKEKYEVYMVGITQDGKWLYTETDVEDIYDGKKWLESPTNTKAILSADSDGTLLIFNEEKVRKIKIDVAFAPIPGLYGEDGRLPALFEMANIPFVGSGSTSSGCSLDKLITRIFADSIGLKQPDCVILRKEKYISNKDFYIEEIKKLGYPIFVKPSSTGSSIGVSKVISDDKIEQAVDEAFEYCNDVLVEKGIIGSELKVALYGNQESLITGSLCQLVADSEGDVFNDYTTKYLSSVGSKKTIPALISKELENEVIKQAKEIFNALNCRDLARADFFLTPDNEIIFNEINTYPGFKETSIYSLMLIDKGYSYKEIVNGLIEMALNR